MPDLVVTYDPEARAAYVRLHKGRVVRTDEVIVDEVWADYDADGQLLGLEILGVKERNLSKLLETVGHALRRSARREPEVKRDLAIA